MKKFAVLLCLMCLVLPLMMGAAAPINYKDLYNQEKTAHAQAEADVVEALKVAGQYKALTDKYREAADQYQGKWQAAEADLSESLKINDRQSAIIKERETQIEALCTAITDLKTVNETKDKIINDQEKAIARTRNQIGIMGRLDTGGDAGGSETGDKDGDYCKDQGQLRTFH
jgi:hypothetical protein